MLNKKMVEGLKKMMYKDIETGEHYDKKGDTYRANWYFGHAAAVSEVIDEKRRPERELLPALATFVESNKSMGQYHNDKKRSALAGFHFGRAAAYEDVINDLARSQKTFFIKKLVVNQ
jgi:cytochrome P450